MRPMTPRPADRVPKLQSAQTERSTKRSNFHNQLSQYRETKVAHKTPRRLQLAGKVPNGVRFGKTCCAATAESATCRTISSALLAAELVLWSWRKESNPRPSDYKSDALPTELRQQLGKGALPRKLIPRIPSRCPGQLFKVSQGKVGVQQDPPAGQFT